MSYFNSSNELPLWASGLPGNWERDWLKWSVHLITERPNDVEHESLPYISNEDISSWTGKLLKEDLESSESDGRKFQTDDVLLNKLRPYLAKVYLAEFEGVSSGELLCLRSTDKVFPRYLFYVLSSRGFIDAIDAETFGSKMPRADWEIVGHQPLPLPALEHQQRIAQFLDEKTAQIDKLIEKKRTLLDRLAEKRRALITRVVTKGLNPDVSMKDSGIEWLGEIPEHWDASELQWISQRIKTGPFGAQLNSSEFVENEVPVLNPSELVGGQISPNYHITVTEETANRLSKYRVWSNDIIFARRGEMGRCAYVSLKEAGWVCGTGSIVVTPDVDLVYPKFLFCFLGSNYSKEWFSLYSIGATMANLSEQILNSFPVCLPPLLEQVEIVDFIDRVSEEYNAQTNKIQRSITLLEEYRSALITAAVTGKL